MFLCDLWFNWPGYLVRQYQNAVDLDFGFGFGALRVVGSGREVLDGMVERGREGSDWSRGCVA